MVAGDWSEIPADLLWTVIERLTVADYTRVGGVCVSWRTVLAEKQHLLPPQLPWLLLPNGTKSSHIRTFSLTDNVEYYFNIPHFLLGWLCIGSSLGWLLFLDLSSPKSEISMFDPISRAQVTLPSIATLPTANLIHRGFFDPYRLIKIVVSPYRSSSFIASAIKFFTSSLALARTGDKSWTTIKVMSGLHKFCDIQFYKKQLWGLTSTGQVVAYDVSDISDPRIILTVQALGLEYSDPLSQRYLVECAGDLLLVWRRLRTEYPGVLQQVWKGLSEEIKGEVETTAVKVFRVDQAAEQVRWVELKIIGDHALFLGNNSSLAVSIRDFPELERNCIYLTNVFRIRDSGSDLLMYKIEDESLEPLLLLCMKQKECPQMFWFTPNLIKRPRKRFSDTNTNTNCDDNMVVLFCVVSKTATSNVLMAARMLACLSDYSSGAVEERTRQTRLEACANQRL